VKIQFTEEAWKDFDRLVYTVDNDALIVISCRYHYE